MAEERHKKVSHSKCEVFNDCMLQGYFKYIIYAKPEERFKDYAAIGKAVHECIQAWFIYYHDVDVSNMSFPGEHFANTMQDFYNVAESKLLPKLASEPISDAEATQLCLENFLDFMVRRLDRVKKLNMVDQFNPIMVEKEYFLKINGVPLQGILDAAFMDSQLWLFDWKSNKKPDITKKYITQAVRYALLLDASGEFDKPITDFYVINLRNRVDLAKAHVIITEEMKQEEEKELLRMWDLMNGTQFSKPGHNKNCFFCEYKLRCLSYPQEGATHDWSIPVEYVSYRKESIPLVAVHSAPSADVMAAAAADAEMANILAELGIADLPNEQIKEQATEEFAIAVDDEYTTPQKEKIVDDDWWNS